MSSLTIEVEFQRKGFSLSSLQIDQFHLYLKQLQVWNNHINLTSVDDEWGIIHKHFLDSLKLLKFVDFPSDCRLIDIGSGAGFPGFPLKIYRPRIDLLLVESVSKKASFLQFVLAQLQQTDPHNFGQVKVIADRAEKLAGQQQFVEHESADVVVTRYVSDLKNSAPYCLPLLKDNGSWYAYKSGPKQLIDKEINSARSVLSQLGAEVVNVYAGTLIEIKGGNINYNAAN